MAPIVAMQLKLSAVIKACYAKLTALVCIPIRWEIPKNPAGYLSIVNGAEHDIRIRANRNKRFKTAGNTESLGK